jgi:hypothetical protein
MIEDVVNIRMASFSLGARLGSGTNGEKGVGGFI